MRIVKHLLGAVAAVAGLSLATAAFAVPVVGGGGPVGGLLTVTGTVTTKCAVITGGSGSTFSGTIALGTLNGANGTLLSALNTSTVSAAAGSQAFQINCNGGDASIDLKASRLSTSGSAATGYSANIDYSASLIAALAAGSTKSFTYTTAASPPTDTIGTLGGRLANGAGNITVKIYGLTPENGLTSLLEAGNYASTITVSITPAT